MQPSVPFQRLGRHFDQQSPNWNDTPPIYRTHADVQGAVSSWSRADRLGFAKQIAAQTTIHCLRYSGTLTFDAECFATGRPPAHVLQIEPRPSSRLAFDKFGLLRALPRAGLSLSSSSAGWIGVGLELDLRLISLVPGVFESDFGIGSERKEPLLAVELELHPPGFEVALAMYRYSSPESLSL